MRNVWKGVILTLALGVFLPPLLMLLPHLNRDAAPREQTTAPTQPQQRLIPVILRDGGLIQLEPEEYIARVVLGEMPASFDSQALMAQAVVARTYMYRTLLTQKHGREGICADHTCCQAYREPEEYLQAGGSRENLQKVWQAVADTRGQVLTYEGELIEALYFSCSGGRTEEAVAVWGTDVPYLQAVDSPGEEEAAYYVNTVYYSTEEFAQCLGLEGSPQTWQGQVRYTQGGGVETMELGGKTFTGTQLRKLLQLRSTAITLTILADRVIITTRGYGHRVGMSQYGADAMARQGADHTQILAHYYSGTQLVQWDD